MIGISGKLESLMAMYEAGFLCKCKKTVFIEVDHGLFEKKLYHGKRCLGRAKVKELILARKKIDV